MIALLDAQRAGLFARRHWLPNIIAGVVVGVVALPLAMAFAIASGVEPEQGIYTSIVAGIAVATLGGSRIQIAGPTGAFIVILSGVTADYGVHGLQIATMMAGVILVLLGLSRLGAVIKFIPDPVIVGFTAGIAVIIFVGQWPAFLGIAPEPSRHFHSTLIGLLRELPTLHPATTVVALVSLLLVVLPPRIPHLRRLPGPLVAVVLVTAAQSAFHFDGVATIGSTFGGIPRGLPHLALPDTTLDQVLALIGPAFTIVMLGSIESLLSAVVADGMAGTRHDSNQELIGQGIANLATPLFGGFAATGAIARTATNIRNGGTSPLAGVIHSVTLILILLLLAPLAANIPLATLAAILFVVAWNMSEAAHFAKIVRRAPRADVTILLITFGLTVFADLVVAVNIGVILATLHFLRRMAASVNVQFATDAEIRQEFERETATGIPPGLMVFVVDGPVFFAAVEKFERTLAGVQADPDTVIIRLRWVPFIDETGLQMLEEVIGKLQHRGVRVILTGANPRVSQKLSRAGITTLIGETNLFAEFRDGFTSVTAEHQRTSGEG